MSEIQCRICASTSIIKLEEDILVPIFMNRLYPTPQEGRGAARGDLALRGCQDCGMVWNAKFVSKLVDYDQNYENDQTGSAFFRSHQAERVADVIGSVPEGLIDYLEVGCGQGSFIRDIAKAAGDRLRSAEGFDPAWRGGPLSQGVRITNAFFDFAAAQSLNYPPNVVASRHTIEHIPDPVSFLSSIRSVLKNDTSCSIFIETPCVDWILERGSIQDFFYEHCSLFSINSLSYALIRSGFSRPLVSHVFGGQYLWARANFGERTSTPLLGNQIDFTRFAGARDRFQHHWKAAVEQASLQGPVAIWGAGAKGVTFSLITDPEGKIIDHVVDINPAKQGLHLAGTGLLVQSPEQSAARGPKTIFIMNPNYLDEIKKLLCAWAVQPDIVVLN